MLNMVIDPTSHTLLHGQLNDLKDQHGSWRAVARHLGVSPAYLCDVLHGRRDPGDGILGPLGLEKVVFYQRRAEEDAK